MHARAKLLLPLLATILHLTPCQHALEYEICRKLQNDEEDFWTLPRGHDFTSVNGIVLVVCDSIDVDIPVRYGSPNYFDYYLIIRYSTLIVLPPHMFNNFPTTRKLFLSGNSIQIVLPGAFEPMARLGEIELQENNIIEIPRNVFESMVSLQWLNLAHNEIFRISDDAFQGSTNLEELQIQENKLTNLNTGVFSSLVNLKFLNLSKNAIESVSSGAFTDLQNLKYLDLQGNNLSQLTNLKVLNLSRNHICIIEDSALLGLKLLEKLLLSENCLSLVNLKEIHLRGNNLSYISKELLSTSVYLEFLDISFNKITVIENTAFAKMPNLKTVYLNNNLGNFSLDTFLENNLQVLDLSGNAYINTCFDGTASIKSKELHSLLLNNSGMQCHRL